MSDPLKQLRNDLKRLLANGRQDELFRRLRLEVLSDRSELYNDAILLESTWNNNQRNDNLGTVTFEHANISFASLGKALTWLIDRVEKGDLSDRYREVFDQHIFIHPQARYSVDRFEQSEQFEVLEFEPPPELLDFHHGKVRFFYLHGDMQQMHQELVRRLGQEKSGAWKDFTHQGYDPEKEPVFEWLKPRTCRSRQLFPIRVISGLMEKFEVSPQPTQSKHLSDLLGSPKLRNKGQDDSVFILLSLDDYNWDKDNTPELIRRLYEHFCDCELPKEAPSFYFFFGIEYSKDNQQVQAEVSKAIAEAQYGISLPKLDPVPIHEVEEWFSQIGFALPPNLQPRQVAQNLFPNQTVIDMAEIVMALKQFIDHHNDGLTFLNE